MANSICKNAQTLHSLLETRQHSRRHRSSYKDDLHSHLRSVALELEREGDESDADVADAEPVEVQL